MQGISERITIVDFGSQVTHLIARRLREAGIYCEVTPSTEAYTHMEANRPNGIILSGGPASLTSDLAPRIDPKICSWGIPILGICYGQQLLCEMLGGRITVGKSGEFGPAPLSIQGDSPLFGGVWRPGEQVRVWMSHGDHVAEAPEGFCAIATSPGAPYAAFADESRRFYGVQFHPEVTQTEKGGAILEAFARSIAGCRKQWSVTEYRSQAVDRIREQVGDGRVICALSGGVDSLVAARLVAEAIGERLVCVFVDHGLLREGEAEQVVETFRAHHTITLLHEEAGPLFLGRLAGIEDPERKRRIIGETFIEIFEAAIERAGGADFLVQGTLYPDVIESQSPTGAPSAVIKSHHNVGGLPERMQLKLVEPLRLLFKDEVRVLGRALGLPEAMIRRHPFPGPGLAIRIPGAVDAEQIEILRKADTIFLDEIRRADLYDRIWQAFAVLLPVRSVGVKGDAPSYERACVLRAVISEDGMTAEAFTFPDGFLAHTGARIANEVAGINRVLYDVTSKPPSTIEWE